MITSAALLAEIQTDPGALGYATQVAAGNDGLLAALLNAINPAIQINRGVIPSYEIINATVPAEWATLSTANKQLYQTLTGAGQVDSGNANTRAAFLAMFAAGATRTALVALATRAGSRAEQLGGAGTVISDLDVARALGRGV